jgi:ribosome-binding factor A
LSNKRSRSSTASPTDIDPKQLFGPLDDHRASRKARQLARQAERALRFAISELADEEVASALIMQVEPAPDSSRLAVTIQPAKGVAPETVEAGLQRAAGSLRAAVADAITRKRAPTLVFHVLPGEVSS